MMRICNDYFEDDEFDFVIFKTHPTNKKFSKHFLTNGKCFEITSIIMSVYTSTLQSVNEYRNMSTGIYTAICI